MPNEYKFDDINAPRDEIYQFVDLKDKLVKVDNSRLAIFEKNLNNIAEYILRHEEVIRGFATQGTGGATNNSAFKDIMKDFDTEINKI